MSNKKPKLYDILSHCKENSIVAFKEIEEGNWFTGTISMILHPNSESNKNNEFMILIDLIVPITPQWYDDEKTSFTIDCISNLVVLEGV